jgi:hypothetical protein
LCVISPGQKNQLSTQNELRQQIEWVRNHTEVCESRLRVHSKSWTNEETIAHLNALLEHYLPLLELSVHRAKARNWVAGERYHTSWLAARMIRLKATANPHKKSAPAVFNFFRKNPPTNGTKRLIIHLERLLKLFPALRQIDLNKPGIPLAPYNFFKISLGNLLQFLCAGHNHHLMSLLGE